MPVPTDVAPRILVADDDPDLRSLLALNLSLEGYRVETAGDGDQAWELAMRAAPEAIVLDVMMPGRDGIDLLLGLREHPRTRDIPIVLLTAKANDADVWGGYRAGAHYYMTKPFDIDELIRFLDSLALR